MWSIGRRRYPLFQISNGKRFRSIFRGLGVYGASIGTAIETRENGALNAFIRVNGLHVISGKRKIANPRKDWRQCLASNVSGAYPKRDARSVKSRPPTIARPCLARRYVNLSLVTREKRQAGNCRASAFNSQSANSSPSMVPSIQPFKAGCPRALHACKLSKAS